MNCPVKEDFHFSVATEADIREVIDKLKSSVSPFFMFLVYLFKKVLYLFSLKKIHSAVIKLF